MTYFNPQSSFKFAENQRRLPIEGVEAEEVQAKISEAEKVSKVSKSDLQKLVEHWHHDLRTIGILLDQSPPDVDRATRMVEELSDELYRQL